MVKLNYLIVQLIEYKIRYETETYNPELDDLLEKTIDYLKLVSDSLEVMEDLLKGD